MDNRTYYQNLLIIQYHNKTNAKATIGAMYDTVIPKNSVTGNNLLEDIRDGFGLDDAVGAQLDILGYYIGVNRLYQGQDFDTLNLMGFTDYGGYSTATYGFNTYSNYASDMSNGILTYAEMISASNKLSDDDFRFLLKLKAAQNNCDHSCYAIDTILYTFFKNELFYIDNQNMTITYFVSSNYTKLLPVMMQKGLLLKPMGVGFTSVLKPNIYFGFCNYNNIDYYILIDENNNYIIDESDLFISVPGNTKNIPNYLVGFSTYSTYDTIEGKELIYKDIINV